jgi:hypothetical protein
VTTVDESIHAALGAAREMLAADEADLELVGIESQVVHLKLVLGSAACADCILERPMLEASLLHGLQEADPSIRGVVVDDPRVSSRGSALGAEALEVDSANVQELFFERDWTDGLPIVPPTPELVERFLDAGGVEGDSLIGAVRERVIDVRAEQVAINAVMAGCKPEYAPIVLAGARALTNPDYNANGALTTTGGPSVCMVVSGPYAAEVGMSSGSNCLGPGNRANATIGRAIRLLALNVIGARVGVADGSSLGNPGKYTLCFAEADPIEPWPSLRVELGFSEAETTVTVLAAEAPRQVANLISGEPEQLVRTMASALRAGHTYIAGKRLGQCFCVFGPEHAAAIRQGGWSREQVRARLAELTRVTEADLLEAGVPIELVGAHAMTADDDGTYPTFDDPANVMIVCAGGSGAGWSACIPAWAPANNSSSVTELVQL